MTQAQAENTFTEDLYSINTKALVVINHSWNILSDVEVVLLDKILTSVKLSLDSVQIVEASSIDPELIKNYKPSAVLGFGVKTTNNISYYTPSKLDNTPILLSDSIQDLDDAKKKSLWISLKQMFLNP